MPVPLLQIFPIPMTEDTNQQLAAPVDADGQSPNSSSQDGTDATPTPPKKAAPRRKVASRKEKDVAAAPVDVATDEPAAVTGEPLVAKTRRPSRKKAVVAAAADEPAARETTGAPSFQPELVSVAREPEASTAQTFDHAPQPAPVAPVREIAPSPSVAPVNDAPPAAAAPVEMAPTVGLVAPSPSVAPETATGAPLIPPASAEPPRFQQGPPQGQQYQNRPDGNYQQGQDRQNRQDRPEFRQDQQGRQGGRFDRHNRHNRNDRNNNDRQQQGGGNQYGQQQNRPQHQPPQQGRDQPPRDQQPQGMDGNRDGFVSRVEEPTFSEGIVEVSGKGFGFLREAKRSFVQTPADVFVTPEVCRKYNLRDGQWIKGEVRRSSRGPQMFRLTELNGEDPEKFKNLPNFDELTSINPKKRIRLETTPDRYTTRVMDLMTPIGKGQRGLIVAPPRTGKTTLLQHIAEAVVKNHPEMKLIILLVDERPEEVTEIRRTVPQAEIMASSNDSDLKNHTRIAQLAMERSKRLVEAGFDVFMLLDSITRMGRAFNNALGGGGGATGSGGVGTRALEIPRKIFAAARNTEEAGSLTIMATALIDTGSRADEVIFLEFKGTGNMELVLDRKISDQRIFPAVDIFASGTRREELLLQPWELDKINVIRRGLAGHKPLEAIERLLSFLKKFPTNAQMLTSLPG